MIELEGVAINTRLVELALEYLASPSESILSELASCSAAQKTYAHACRFGNTNASRFDFWRSILTDALKEKRSFENRIQSNLTYIESNEGVFLSAIQETAEYLPPDYNFQTRLNLILGYDIGIVSRGEAMLNIEHPHFSAEKRELVYMAMHELHHVGYTDYNPIYSLSDLQTLDDLRHAIRYSTHLEGLAVYAPLDRRISENGLGHEDYQFLVDSHKRQSRVREYFEILEALDKSRNRELNDSDFEILEKMSGRGSRLWYVTGAHMCKTIDEELGREALTETIQGGPNSFFAVYDKATNMC